MIVIQKKPASKKKGFSLDGIMIASNTYAKELPSLVSVVYKIQNSYQDYYENVNVTSHYELQRPSMTANRPANPGTIPVLRFQAPQLWFTCETVSHITTITSQCNHSGFLCKKELKHKRLTFDF